MKGLLLVVILMLAFIMGCGVPQAQHDELLKEKVALDAKYESLTKAKSKAKYDELANDKDALQAKYDKVVDERDMLVRERHSLVKDNGDLRIRVVELEEKLKASGIKAETPVQQAPGQEAPIQQSPGQAPVQRAPVQ